MRDRTAWLLGLILSLVAVSGACAGEPYSFDATPGKLPKTVVPIHYALDLKPDLDKLTISGSEAIEIEVRAPSDRIVLNAVRMTFASAAVDGVGNAKVSFDADEGNATLTFARRIEPGRYTLRIAFSGRINERVGGASRVDYRVGQSSKRLLMTHLQPDEARQVFPSFDEPTFKATFDLAVTVPRSFLAVSNMPVSSEDQVAGGLKRVSFQRTPAMPTYVFALVAGELERTSQEVDGITVGIVHAPGRQAATRFALESGATLVRYYSDYTGVKYMLPKLDLIAIPGRAGAAHENWGAITFGQTSLLIDPPATSFNARRQVFMLVAHEMAHQWFGNLVTMAWWDNLWLNEAFATWMESKTVELFHPEWPSWLYAADDKQAAMAIDAGSETRPMHRIVSTRREMNAMFDPITYNKGAAVVRMLENYLGADVFRDGVRRYMAKRAYSNATPADLWRALEEASGKGVEAFSGAFVEQAGVPLVVANGSCVDGRQQIKVSQERFTLRDPKAQPRHWQVPIVFGPAAGAAQRNLLDGGGDLVAGACNEIVKLNLGNAGYYRVEYDAGTHAMLAKAMGTMLSADRINLLGDTWALFEAGRKPPEAYADLVDNLPADDDHWVWELVVRAIKRVDDLSRDRPGRAAFQDYVRSLLRPVMNRVGWEPVAGEAPGRAELRALVIRTLGDFGDADALAEARRRFVAFESDPGSLVTDLRQPVLHLAGRGADRATYDRLVALARNTSDNEERRGYYAAAAAAVDPGLLRSTLALALESGLSSSTIESVINEVAAEHRDLAWQFIRDNFSVLSKQGTSFANNLLVKVVSEFADPARAEEVANFAPLNETERGRRAAERAKAQIMANAELAARLSGLDSWIAARLARR